MGNQAGDRSLGRLPEGVAGRCTNRRDRPEGFTLNPVEDEPVLCRVYTDEWVNSEAYSDMLRIECERRSEILLAREAAEKEKARMKTFDMLARGPDGADGLHEVALELAKAKGVTYREALLLLDREGRVTFGGDPPPRVRKIDLLDRAMSQALADETRKRIELSRIASITAHGDVRDETPFNVALNAVVADVQAGKSIAGIEAKEEA